MSLWIEEKYLRFLSPQLDRFAQKGKSVYNFRCPLCGDSEHKRTKARGYCFPKRQVLLYKCHNCDISLPFVALLRRLAPQLYNEYLIELMRDETRSVDVTPDPPESSVSDDLRSQCLVPIATLKGSPQRVYRYVVSRQIPESAHHRIYATEKAQTWIRPLVGDDKAGRVVDNEPYLVMPMVLPDGEWFGAQMRMLGRKEYITFRWAHSPLKIFGMDAWNSNEWTWFVEGPLDALFVPNALAVMGSDLLSGARILEEQGFLNTALPRAFVWDNEPRNKEVVRHIETAVQMNQSVVIWPREYPKDINDMVLVGIDVIAAMKKRSFHGLSAALEFQAWKR
jgi:hypothetical protein